MLINQFGQTYYAGEGIDLHPGNQFAISDAMLAAIAGAVQETLRNAPNGFVGLDELSTAFAAVRVQYVDHTIADGLIPREGEIIVVSDTKELRYGDGLKFGGFRAGLNSNSMIYCGGDGTPTENGLAVSNAYAVARNANPNGMAKSITNKMGIVLGYGVHDVFGAVGALNLDTPFIEIIGLDMDGCRVNLSNANIASTNYNFGFRNLTFYKGSTSHGWVLRFNQVGVEAPVVMNWENLRFEGNVNTDTIVSVLSRESGTVSSFNGTAKNVKSICQQWLSAGTGFTNHTNNMIFDDCEMGNRYIAPQGGNRNLFAGQMRNCIWNNTTANNYEVMSGAVIHNCKFGMPLNFCNSGSRITYCRFVPVAAVASLKGTSATQNVFVAHCELSATGIDATTLNNTAGANAYNVLSDN